MDMNHFVIDKVSWHTRVEGNPENAVHIRRRFWAVVRFLQENGLTTRSVAASEDDIGEDFALVSADLTDRGLELMKRTYDKWLTRVDQGVSCDDTSIFEKELAKF